MSTAGGRDNSTKIVLIVLGVLGGVVLLCGGGIIVSLVAITILGKSATATFSSAATGVSSSPMSPVVSSGPAASAGDVHAAFLQDLKSGNAEAAYGRTTAAFRQRQSLDQFRALVNKAPGLRNFKSSSNASSSTGSTAKVDGTVTSPAGQTSYTVELVHEPDGWKVDQFTVR
jgi:hypothetical protein